MLDYLRFVSNSALPGARESISTLFEILSLYVDYSVLKIFEFGSLKLACLILSFWFNLFNVFNLTSSSVIGYSTSVFPAVDTY